MDEKSSRVQLGKLIWEPKNLQAYADYFVRFVKEYQHEGITIDQIHVQNEPVANQKFPSCMWTGAELKRIHFEITSVPRSRKTALIRKSGSAQSMRPVATIIV
mgnify:CR=1 FL=1